MSSGDEGGRRGSSEMPRLENPLSAAAREAAREQAEEAETEGSPHRVVRGRGQYRFNMELTTVPSNITAFSASPQASGQQVLLLSNFVRISPMAKRDIFQYRVDFEPLIESVSLRKRAFKESTKNDFTMMPIIFDGMSDARSSKKLDNETTEYTIRHPTQPDEAIKVILKFVGIIVWNSAEMYRLYNMHMKSLLTTLGFFRVSTTGAFVHPALKTTIGSSQALCAFRGYKTAINIYRGDTSDNPDAPGEVLINLEAVHKLMQNQTVLQNMGEIRQRSRGDFRAEIQAQLSNKLVVTHYNKDVYKIGDVNFNLNPESTFPDRKSGRDISYVEYFQTRWNLTIKDKRQPLLLVTPNRRSRDRGERGNQKEHDIHLVPELCNIAGLTEAQRNDNRLKMDLIRSSQISPKDRVAQLATFLGKLNSNSDVETKLTQWGYSYGNEPVTIKARLMPIESIAVGSNVNQSSNLWPKVDKMGGFDNIVIRDKLAKKPDSFKMAIIISRTNANAEGDILNKLKRGFDKVGLEPSGVEVVRIDNDSAQSFTTSLRRLGEHITTALVVLPQQNKERYDAVKKLASVERGLITQVVTARLMSDDRKAGGAATKIGIQLAAKLGGEPWHINLPLPNAMICGYDTYHDTAKRGRSYGAFIASMNAKYSRWFSKADEHERLDELSSHLTGNVGTALGRYKEQNDVWPDRLIIYRDGVGDGQIEHVFKTELKEVKEAVEKIDRCIKLTFIIVNKRVGARFYMKSGNDIDNAPPGTVIDKIVTRKERYDFYLISQSTRHGTVAPTYYNIIHDDSSLPLERLQMLSFKMCFNYYNWTGTVRVPAPCQYAHKLALLCGEHLHSVPNSHLDDKLHFL